VRNALMIPQRAVSELQGKYQVAVVTPDNKIAIRFVDVGAREGENWIVTSGVKLGEQVVSEGVSKVRDGMPVVPKPDSYKSTGG
jgi:membrane fusion protein (multidrug efflux system)